MNNSVQLKLFSLMNHAIEWQLILAALKSNVFDSLADWNNAEAIAAYQGWNSAQTQLFLDALVASEVLDKQQNQYKVKHELSLFLRLSSAQSMRDTLMHLSNLRFASAEQILELLAGQIDQQVNLTSNTFWQQAVSNLRSFHQCGTSESYLELLSRLPSWQSTRSMLEIGAGSDILANLAVNQCPALQYHIFDLPQVIEQISPKYSSNDGQIFFHSGDYNQVSIPIGFDLIFASMSLYYVQDPTRFYQSIHRALNHSGVFVSLHEGLNQARTQPYQHVVGRIVPALKGNDVSFCHGEISQYLIHAGFTKISSEVVPSIAGPLELIVATK
ncbi:O-methyltransferase [Vibrio ponticus]|nr:O-methyltransferase [Vibrio ponticus]